MSDIHEALAAVMADCTSVAKRDRNTHQNFMFRGIDAVVNAVGPILRKHSVTVVPILQNVQYDTVNTSTGKPATACRVIVTYRFSTLDGSNIDATVAGEAWDAGDKAAPKAMSVAFRTALLQALALPTDEADPDSNTYVQEHRPAERLAAAPSNDPFYDVAPTPDEPITAKTNAHMHVLFAAKGVLEEQQLPGANHILGTAYTSRKQITEEQAKRIIAVLKKRPDVPDPEPKEEPK